MMKRYDTVVFDFGYVLIDPRSYDYLVDLGLTPEGEEFIRTKVQGTDLWWAFDRAAKSREELTMDIVRLAPHLEKDIRTYLEGIYECLKPYPYTESWLAALKKAGYKLYGLTNWPVGAKEELTQRGDLDFTRYLDGVIWSCDLHYVKPEPQIYEALINTYGLTPETAVFIDDSEKNLNGAKPFGFTTIQFKGLADAKAALAALGIEE